MKFSNKFCNILIFLIVWKLFFFKLLPIFFNKKNSAEEYDVQGQLIFMSLCGDFAVYSVCDLVVNGSMVF